MTAKRFAKTASLSDRFAAIVASLIAIDAVKEWDTKSWQVPDTQAEIIPFLQREGVSHSQVIEAIALALNKPVYQEDRDGEPLKSGDGWFLSGDTLWVSNPFGDALQKRLQDRQGGLIAFSRFGFYVDHNFGGDPKSEDEEARDTELDAMLNEVIESALTKGASDIHISPRTAETLSVLMRVDGVLGAHSHRISMRDYSAFSNRVLNRAGAYGGATTKPFSDKFTHTWKGREAQIRIEARPVTVDGDRSHYFVLRLLNPTGGVRRLENIGFNDLHYTLLNQLANRSKGLFLVTGPTGSGKTTTLYALLQKIRELRPGDSIQTLEDPVEVEIPGIEQTSINATAEMTFEAGIRSALRSDPDVILIGEIRDKETAKQALVASETGHLVLATLHTNSAAATISRLLSFDLDRITLANALVGVTAQRMVRKVCQHCSEQIAFGDVPYYIENYGDLESAPKPTDLIRRANPRGCEKCEGGYSGRHVICEIMMIDPATERLIVANSAASEIESLHVAHGFEPLWGHAISLIRDGLTTIEEAESRLDPRNTHGDNYDYRKKSSTS